jgi:tripartite-type tricarboxylate transporter receptor subunit TctC
MTDSLQSSAILFRGREQKHRGCFAVVETLPAQMEGGMRKLLLALAFVTLTAVTIPQAEPYPSRPITLVAPVAAGGPLDVNARLVAAALSDVLGQQVIVENRTGAGTAIGTASVARAAPDGYTLLLADMTFVAGPSLIANLSYEPQRDFVPVAFLSRSNMLLVVNLTFPAGTVPDLVAMAKQKPGELQYAHAGLGTPPHLAALAFTRATAISLSPIAYRGAGPAVVDIVAGRIPMMFLGLSISGPQVTSGKFRALAVTGPQRVPTFPEVPTFAESGVDLGGISGGTWFGIVAPTRTPTSVIARLNEAVNQTLKDPKTRSGFEATSHTVVGGTPEEFGAFLGSQQTYWSSALEAAGVRPN